MSSKFINDSKNAYVLPDKVSNNLLPNYMEYLVIDIFYHGIYLNPIRFRSSTELKKFDQSDYYQSDYYLKKLTFESFPPQKEIKAGNSEINNFQYLKSSKSTNHIVYNPIPQNAFQSWGGKDNKFKIGDIVRIDYDDVKYIQEEKKKEEEKKNSNNENIYTKKFKLYLTQGKDTGTLVEMFLSKTLVKEVSDNIAFMKHNNELSVLLGFDITTNLFRVLGGHRESTDKNSELGAKRETFEESGLDLNLYKKDLLYSYTVKKKLPSEIQESRRGLIVKKLSEVTRNNTVTITSKTNNNLYIDFGNGVNYMLSKSSSDKNANSTIESYEASINDYNLELLIPNIKISDNSTLNNNDVYIVIGKAGKASIKSTIVYELYDYNEALKNGTYISNDPKEKLISKFFDLSDNFLDKLLKYRLFHWDAHYGLIMDGYQFFHKFLPMKVLPKEISEKLKDNSIVEPFKTYQKKYNELIENKKQKPDYKISPEDYKILKSQLTNITNLFNTKYEAIKTLKLVN